MPLSTVAIEVLSAASLVMRALQVRWCVYGSQAVHAYGVPRPAEDVDISAALSREQASSFVESMKQAGFEVREGTADERVLSFIHRRTGVQLNAIIASSSLEIDFLTRAPKLNVGGMEVPVISAEDLIVTKLLVGRPKDLEDIRGVIEEQDESLDLELVRGMVREMQSALQRKDLLPVLESLVPGARPAAR